jgi:cytoskeleton protein RodZ
VLSFDEDAWVEVKDADGKVVFSQLSPAGASRTVEGKAPLSFVVGNAHHVKLKVDDKPYDIKPHIGVTVARFSVQ